MFRTEAEAQAYITEISGAALHGGPADGGVGALVAAAPDKPVQPAGVNGSARPKGAHDRDLSSARRTCPGRLSATDDERNHR